MPHAEGAETTARASAILATFALNVAWLAFATLFYVEAQFDRTFNLFALTLGYAITITVLGLWAVISYFLDYSFREEDERKGQETDSSSGAYMAMLRSPRYVWVMWTWGITTTVGFGGCLILIFSFYKYLNGTTLDVRLPVFCSLNLPQPPVEIAGPLVLTGEVLRWMTLTNFVAFDSFLNFVLGLYALHTYGLRTEEPIDEKTVLGWVADRGFQIEPTQGSETMPLVAESKMT